MIPLTGVNGEVHYVAACHVIRLRQFSPGIVLVTLVDGKSLQVNGAAADVALQVEEVRSKKEVKSKK